MRFNVLDYNLIAKFHSQRNVHWLVFRHRITLLFTPILHCHQCNLIFRQLRLVFQIKQIF